MTYCPNRKVQGMPVERNGFTMGKCGVCQRTVAMVGTTGRLRPHTAKPLKARPA